MKIETLIVTVDQHDMSLIEQMNVQTDTVVGNQSDFEAEETTEYKGNHIVYCSTKERGVGKNRNLVLDKSTADICVLADDDMRFVDGYPQIVELALKEASNADVLIFNLIEKNPRRYRNTKVTRIHRWNYAKYGAARFVLRRESIVNKGIRFSLQFGGGAPYSAGEDTLFLHECLKKGLNIAAVPYAIAEIDQSAESTWFCGYNEKYFYDKGALYQAMSPLLAPIYAVRFVLKHSKRFQKEMSCSRALKNMLKGMQGYRNGRAYGNQ